MTVTLLRICEPRAEAVGLEVETPRIPMTLWQDIRYSLRSLHQNPALTTTCFVVLALGIGANTTIFTAVKAVLLDPLPYRDPGRLVALYEAGVVKGDVHDEPAPANFYDWQRQSRSFQEIAAYGGTSANVSGGFDRLPEHIEGVFCSWNLFQTLGIPASVGRVFVPSDDTPRAARTTGRGGASRRSRRGRARSESPARSGALARARPALPGAPSPPR